MVFDTEIDAAYPKKWIGKVALETTEGNHMLERSVLSVPGSNWRMIEKAATLAADIAFIDLEDAVAASAKVASRQHVIKAFQSLDWNGKPRAYRMNALDTPFFYRDIIDIVEKSGDLLDVIIVPKVSRPEDLFVVDTLLTQIEVAMGFAAGKIKLEAQIENALGLLNVERIALATSRLSALVFGPGDYAASMHMPMTNIGVMDKWDEQYPGHRFHYALARIAVAARAAGIHAIDGPCADFKDLDAYRKTCIVARALGYDGKWCIHPNQIAITNEVFSPTAQELQWAHKVVNMYQEALAKETGAIRMEDQMIDMASLRLAQAILQAAGEK
jgi:citrate lyase beta subunit